MKHTIVIVILMSLVLGCTDEPSKESENPGACTEGVKRCSVGIIEICENGAWKEWHTCDVGQVCKMNQGEPTCSSESGETDTVGNVDGDTDGDTDGDGDGDGDADADGDSDVDTDTDTDADGDGNFVLTDCDPAKTCEALEHPEDCVANFGIGTTQAGFTGIAGTGAGGLYSEVSLYFDSDFPYVGWYSYNDYSNSGTMIPEKDLQPRPVEAVGSCAANEDFAIHLAGEGWNDWGSGIEMFWGGENNPACYEDDGVIENPDSIACREAFFVDDRIKLADIGVLPECDTPKKVECATKGKRLKITRDLSVYKGLGFWIVTTPENEAAVINVHFPIPATTRWESAGVAGDECDNEDDTHTNDCANDFATSVNLSPADVNKWVYKEVLFEDLAQNPDWGFQFPEGMPFPSTQSIGLKFQLGFGARFDFYIDDIILLR